MSNNHYISCSLVGSRLVPGWDGPGGCTGPKKHISAAAQPWVVHKALSFSLSSVSSSWCPGRGRGHPSLLCSAGSEIQRCREAPELSQGDWVDQAGGPGAHALPLQNPLGVTGWAPSACGSLRLRMVMVFAHFMGIAICIIVVLIWPEALHTKVSNINYLVKLY